MKPFLAAIAALSIAQAFAAATADAAATAGPTDPIHRYVIERTFPAGALAGLDSAAKAKVNATNSKFGAQWVTSYANSSKTKTYCVYNAADEAAVRAAAKANNIPVDKITEVPVAATSGR